MYLTVKDIAQRFNVCEQTIRNFIKRGEIRAVKTSNSKMARWRIHQAEAEAFFSKKFENNQRG